MTFTGLMLPIMKTMFYDNFVTPTNANRFIDLFTWRTSMDGDPVFNLFELENIFEISTLYDVIKYCCLAHGLGFKVEIVGLTADPPNIRFRFTLVVPVDRSYGQTENPWVVFAESFDNVVSSEYIVSAKDYLNIACVVWGENEATERTFVHKGVEPSGIERREGIVRTNTLEVTDTDVIQQKGKDLIDENKPQSIFDGSVIVDVAGSGHRVNADFYLGDIVQCVFGGVHRAARIIELVKTMDQDGQRTFASFDFNI